MASRSCAFGTTSFGRASLLGRTVDYLTFYLAALFSLIWRVRPGDLVVAKTDPPMLSALTVPLSHIRGARAINWLQDVFPEVAEELGIGTWRAQRPLLALLRAMRNATLCRASVNVVLGHGMARKLIEFGVPDGRIRIIPNWARGELIRPVAPQGNALRKEWGLDGAFVAGYSGNLGRAHDIETFLAAIAALEETALAAAGMSLPGGALECAARKVRWLFTGGGAQMEKLKSEVQKRKLRSVLFQPYQPWERLSESLSVPDVHLISLRPSLEGLIVPSKYYGIVAAGRPAIFVGDPNGEIAQAIRRSATGFAVCEGDGAGLVEAILTLAGEPELAAVQGLRARALFEAEFDFPHIIAAWRKPSKRALQR